MYILGKELRDLLFQATYGENIEDSWVSTERSSEDPAPIDTNETVPYPCVDCLNLPNNDSHRFIQDSVPHSSSSSKALHGVTDAHDRFEHLRAFVKDWRAQWME